MGQSSTKLGNAVARFGYLFLVTAMILCLAPPLVLSQIPPGKSTDEHGPAGIIPVPPALNQNCTASLQNRTVAINPDGSFIIGNIPA